MKKKKNPRERQKKRISKTVILIIILIVLNIIYAPRSKKFSREIEEPTFKQFMEKGFIKYVEIEEVNDKRYGHGYNIYWDSNSDETNKLFIEKHKLKEYNNLFRKYNVEAETIKKSWIFLIISCIIFVSVLLAFRMSGVNKNLASKGIQLKGVKHFRSEFSGLTGIGANNDSEASEEKPTTTFKDVAGCDEAKAEVQELVEFLKNPERFTRLGGKMPKGIALVGPPGTGKTLLAKAMAGEANVPMISKSGSDFMEKYVGVGASRVRDLFDRAESKAPCIVFIDEAESVGRRGGSEPQSTGESEEARTINAMLTRMDGFKPSMGILLVLATNRPDMLDKALLRPGRIDRQVVLSKPDIKGREEILRVHARTVVMSPRKNEDLKYMAKISTGLVGADLANIINEAAIHAAKNGKKHIEKPDLEYALEKVMSGAEQKSRIMSKEQKKRVAYHEAGHTIIAEMLPHALKPRKVSIMPRGLGALGQTMLMPEEEKQLTTKDELLDNISTLYGGRVAEELIYNNSSTGSQNDQERATQIVKQIICVFGMDETIGVRTFGRSQTSHLGGPSWIPSTDYGEETKKQIDDAIKKIIEKQYKATEKIISEQKDKLEKMTQELMKKETLGREEIVEIMQSKKP